MPLYTAHFGWSRLHLMRPLLMACGVVVKRPRTDAPIRSGGNPNRTTPPEAIARRTPL